MAFSTDALWLDIPKRALALLAIWITAIILFMRDTTPTRHATGPTPTDNTQQWLQDTIDMVPALIFFKDHHGRFLMVNQAMADAYGMTKEQIVGSNNVTIYPDKMQVRQFLAQDLEVIETDRPRVILDARYVMPDGHVILARTIKIPIRTGMSSMPAVLGIAIDETAQRLADEARHKTVNLLQSFFDLDLIGMAITSPEKGWIEVNDKLCDFFGYSRNELTRMTWAQLTHPEDLEKDVNTFNRVLAGEIDGYSLEKRFIRKDGAVINAKIDVQCIRKEDETVDHFVALVADISDRKKAEAKIQESENRLRQIIDLVPHMIFAKDAEGRFLLANQAAADAYHLNVDEMIGRKELEICPTEQREQAQAYLADDLQVIATQRPMLIHQEELTLPNGDILVEHVLIIPFLTEHGQNAVLGVATDITDLRRAERLHKDQAELLEHVIAHVPNNVFWKDRQLHFQGLQ